MVRLKKIVVIGGGITGLSTMHYLQKLKNEKSLDIELVLVEANEYLGGKNPYHAGRQLHYGGWS